VSERTLTLLGAVNRQATRVESDIDAAVKKYVDLSQLPLGDYRKVDVMRGGTAVEDLQRGVVEWTGISFAASSAEVAAAPRAMQELFHRVGIQVEPLDIYLQIDTPKDAPADLKPRHSAVRLNVVPFTEGAEKYGFSLGMPQPRFRLLQSGTSAIEEVPVTDGKSWEIRQYYQRLESALIVDSRRVGHQRFDFRTLPDPDLAALYRISANWVGRVLQNSRHAPVQARRSA
jgi:hypothetical protein